MAVTLKEVADLAGVSRSAVSRAFTPGASVSPRTRAKIQAAADTLGYRPNALASSLTTGRTKLIGLVVSNFKNPMFMEVLDRSTRALQDRGLRPLLVNLSGQTDPEASVDMMVSYSVDGVIVASSTLPTSFARAFRDAGLPVVHAFGRPSSVPDVHVVGIDNVECGRMAARALIARGYRQIAFLGGPESATSTQDRRDGFLQEVAQHPAITTDVVYAQAYSHEAGFDAMMQAVGQGAAQGYFCGDDVVALGALAALKTAGRIVPGDVGLIGLNDMEMAGWQNNNLTTIRQPIDPIVQASVELIEAMLDDPDRFPEARLFPCEVIDRGTLP